MVRYKVQLSIRSYALVGGVVCPNLYSGNRFVCATLENLHADQTTNYMFWAITEAEGEVGIP